MVDQILPLVLNDVTVRKRGKSILGPVSLKLSESGFTIVMGANGSGKTSMLRTINGLESVRTGSIAWNCETRLAQKKQAFVFQTPILLRRTVLANIVYPLTLSGMAKHDAETRARNWIEKVNLGEFENQNATLLSGGEKQKLAIIRALAAEPQLLILDEPTANLDGKATREIEELLRGTREQGTRIIMSTHDIGQARRLAEDVVFLYRGQIHEHVSAAGFFEKAGTAEGAAFLRGDIVE